jgi:hypothetical protein
VTRPATSTSKARLQHGDTEIAYTIVRSARRKRTVEIRLDATLGVLVAAPRSASLAQIETIVRKRAPWIAQRAAESALLSRERVFATGERLHYLGEDAPILVSEASGRTVRVLFSEGMFHIAVPAYLVASQRHAAVHRALSLWYRRRALEAVQASVSRWSAVTGYVPSNVLVREQKRRWGSCAADGTLRFNWRLIIAEPALLDYVVVHELVHLRHKNHAAGFWDDVRRLVPDCQALRRRLNDVGWALSI